MLRNLHTIEIAEGALLADIAVVFRFIALVLPAGSAFFSIFNFIIFAVLVLRRGMYVASMGMCVAVFLAGIVMGLVVLEPVLLAWHLIAPNREPSPERALSASEGE